MLERVRVLAGMLHHKINLGEDEPLIRIVLVGFVRDYGPEAWTIDYHIEQDALGNDIWRTRVLRPSYNQLYPPEKGKPKTFMEVRYPPENRATGEPELLDLLQQNDSRLAKIRAANEIQAKSVTLAVEGQSQKSDAASRRQFLEGGASGDHPAGDKTYDGEGRLRRRVPVDPPAAESSRSAARRIRKIKRLRKKRRRNPKGPRSGTSLKIDWLSAPRRWD